MDATLQSEVNDAKAKMTEIDSLASKIDAYLVRRSMLLSEAQEAWAETAGLARTMKDSAAATDCGQMERKCRAMKASNDSIRNSLAAWL